VLASSVLLIEGLVDVGVTVTVSDVDVLTLPGVFVD